MSKADMQDILGKPKILDGDPDWIYERVGNPGWVEIHFDAQGRLDRLNDESAQFSGIYGAFELKVPDSTR